MFLSWHLCLGYIVLEVPILWAEQNPKGLGPTVQEIAGLLPDLQREVRVDVARINADQNRRMVLTPQMPYSTTSCPVPCCRHKTHLQR